MPEITLEGCRSRPLAGYLKALGILALVSAQKDVHATGHWDAECFVLHSDLDAQEMPHFFLHEYVPTPIVTPWNGGSGFYAKDNQKGITAIAASTEERLSGYRRVLSLVREWMKQAVLHSRQSAETWRTQQKQDIQVWCRATLPEECLSWLDAAFILKDADAVYPPLLGTGGNDGRLDFGNNYMQHIASLLIGAKFKPAVPRMLQAALFGVPTDGMVKINVGQFDPGNAGGANQGMGIKNEDVPANPWDFIFMLEGALLFAGSMNRKNPSDPGQVAAPFVVGQTLAGFASASLAGKGRGEIWLPLWPQPATLGEIRHVLREGRAVLGKQRARTGLDFSRAVGSLGVDRGITAFERYTFLERRGKSFVALPAGRVPVRFAPNLNLLEEAESALRSARKIKNAPASLTRAGRFLEQTLFQCALQPDAKQFQQICRALARLDALPVITALPRPFKTLSPDWIRCCDDGSPEVRLAAALASVHSPVLGPLRCALSPIQRTKTWEWSEGDAALWQGQTLYAKLGWVLAHRLMDGARLGVAEGAFQARIRLHPADVVPLLRRQVDTAKLEDLIRAFSLVDFCRHTSAFWTSPLHEQPMPYAWMLLKLVHMPQEQLQTLVPEGKSLRPEPRIAHLLRAGRSDEALALAERRLRITGLPLRPMTCPTEAVRGMDASALLASLLVPVHITPTMLRRIITPTETV